MLPVADTHRAYQDLARAWRRQLGLPLVVVTGSAGKTTTRDWKPACCHDGSKGAEAPGAQHVHWCNGSIRNLGLWALCGKRRTSTSPPLRPNLPDPGLSGLALFPRPALECGLSCSLRSMAGSRLGWRCEGAAPAVVSCAGCSPPSGSGPRLRLGAMEALPKPPQQSLREVSPAAGHRPVAKPLARIRSGLMPTKQARSVSPQGLTSYQSPLASR